MKYYSEILKKAFDSEKECLAAEEEYEHSIEVAKRKKEELAKERKARAQEVEAALKEVQAAREKYDKLLTAFCKDYGAFHYSWTSENVSPSIFDFLNCF